MRVWARATRSGSWWAVEVPDVEGAFTQTKRLDQVPAMVADAVSLLTGTPADEIQVDVQPQLDEQLEADLHDLRVLWNEVAAKQHKASLRTREVVATLRGQGLSVRDVGQIIGLSPQRVSQLEHSEVLDTP